MEDVEVCSWNSSMTNGPPTFFLKGTRSVWASILCCCRPSVKKEKIYVPKKLLDLLERRDNKIDYRNAQIEGQRIAYEQRIYELADIINGLLSGDQESGEEKSNFNNSLKETSDKIEGLRLKNASLEAEFVNWRRKKNRVHNKLHISETKLVFDLDALCMRREFRVKNVDDRRIACDLYANEKHLKLVVFPNWLNLDVGEELTVQVTCYGHRKGAKKWTTIALDSAYVPAGITTDEFLANGLRNRRQVYHREVVCLLK